MVEALKSLRTSVTTILKDLSPMVTSLNECYNEVGKGNRQCECLFPYLDGIRTDV